jgi:hypothetical protein
MERQECVGFGDGMSSLLHIDGLYGERESRLLVMVTTMVFEKAWCRGKAIKGKLQRGRRHKQRELSSSPFVQQHNTKTHQDWNNAISPIWRMPLC